MIEIFTLGKPSEKIKALAQELFALEKGAYNLPTHDHPHQALFDQLYKLGVGQIVHDGIADKIVCLNGYKYALDFTYGSQPNDENVLVIER